MSLQAKGAVACILVVGVSLFWGTSVKVDASVEKRWEFRVLLDDKEIGYHQVRLVPEADRKRVSVETRFDVKFLFLTAYHYEHQTEELWQGSCLADIRSHTNDNGKELFLRAESASNGVRLITHNGPKELQGCVRSFAYWDPELLGASRLLNTQTGEYQDVQLIDLGKRPIEIDGRLHDARQYRLLVEDHSIDLWYTPDMDWLALQTTIKSGRRLSYFPAKRMLQ